MQTKIEALKTVSGSFRGTLQALDNLGNQEVGLKSELELWQARLAKLPVESLEFVGSDDKSFDRTTARMLSSRDNIRVKLDLLPGIRVRYQAQAQGLGQQVRAAVKALIGHCRELARVKMEELEVELATHLLGHYGGDADRAKSAAAKALRPSHAMDVFGGAAQGCDAWKWQEEFAHYSHASDPLEDAETAIGLAESFARNEPCN